ncbi:MAG TPA: class I SAM-dependent methyltransferase [Caulobacteraceae bacterium]|nr:class I SAM-dependent methyltransferase [Caulobacteraceae bacterium]
MSESNSIGDHSPTQPDGTAVRVALWRAMHVDVDPPPHVLEDVIGLQLAAPAAGWQSRGDMNPRATSRNRASIVARARFIEDLVEERARRGVDQYVVLGAGLDTFAQRKPEIASRVRVFEVDQPAAQAWKRRRLIELGFGVPVWLRLVPADLEAVRSSPVELRGAPGRFDLSAPAVRRQRRLLACADCMQHTKVTAAPQQRSFLGP